MATGSDSRICVVIPAAGSGTRLGEPTPKAFVDLGGRSIIERCVDNIPQSLGASIVVVVPADLVAHARVLLPGTVTVVVGGAHRSESVRAGIAASGDADIVLVHDAARPLTPASVFARVVDAVRSGRRAVVPGVPVADTLKEIAPISGPTGGADSVGAESGLDFAVEPVTRTVDRELLRAVQTPQGFTREALVAAHADDQGLATDDAGLAERIGIEVHVVPGDPLALKITTPWDLRIVRDIVAEQGVAEESHAEETHAEEGRG